MHKARTVFLAGATGLAGHSILRRLLLEPGVERILAGHTSYGGVFVEHPRVTYVRGDLRNTADCERIMAGADLAILAAAQSGGAQEAASQPWKQVTDNIVMDAVQLEVLHKVGVRRAVYVSSATVYPETHGYLKERDLDWNQPPAPAYRICQARCGEPLSFLACQNGIGDCCRAGGEYLRALCQIRPSAR
jgi:nucleoside-diphosphate-sugar epimerase